MQLIADPPGAGTIEYSVVGSGSPSSSDQSGWWTTYRFEGVPDKYHECTELTANYSLVEPGVSKTGIKTWSNPRSGSPSGPSWNGGDAAEWDWTYHEGSGDKHYAHTLLSVTAHFSTFPCRVRVLRSPSWEAGVVSVSGSSGYVWGDTLSDAESGTNVTITATANEGYKFVGWTSSKGNTSDSSTYTYRVYEKDETWTANFVKTFTVNVVADPDDGGTVSGAGEYAEGAWCTITAEAAEGYRFVRWTSDKGGSSDDSTHSFSVSENVTWTAEFERTSYTVEVVADPSNGGVVTGGGDYEPGAQCTVTATANEGYRFKNWTSDKGGTSESSTFYFLVYDDVTWTAHFVKLYDVSVSADAGGSASGGGKYEDGSRCTITATADAGYSFTGWTSDKGGSASSSSHTFTVTEDIKWIAHFARRQYKITVSVSPENAGSASGDGEFSQGESCTVSASKRCSPWTFDHWEDDKGATRSSDQSYMFNVTESLALIAKFTHPDTGEIMCDSQGNILSTADGAIIYNGDLVEA